MSRYNRNVPRPVRLRRCCVGATGALTCYSLQLARGEEYLMRLNDGDNRETYVCNYYVILYVCNLNLK